MKQVLKRVLAFMLGGPFVRFIPSHIIKLVSSEKAEQIVAIHSPDPGNSAICVHEWPRPDYDLSIIIPVYNADRFLERCLDSVINQKTRFSYHVIVVNDGSSDNSADILVRYRDIVSVTIIDQENGGAAMARNTGLMKVRGRFIMFVDADDLLPVNAVDSLICAAYDMNADIVQGGYLYINESGDSCIKKRIHKRCNHVAPNGILEGLVCGKIYRADLFQQVCFPEGYWFEDTIITAIITHLANNIAMIPDICYLYRTNSSGMTSIGRGRPKSVDSFWVQKRVLSERKKLGLMTDCAFYEHLLRMVALCYKRTENEPRDIQLCLLTLWKDLLEQERSEFLLKGKYRNLEQAIMEGDFGKYRILCKYCF